MTRLFIMARKTIIISCSLMLALFLVAVVLTVRTSTQSSKVPGQKDKDALLQQIENSMEQPLRFVGNEECPLKIVQATVKEISGAEFTRLTRKTTDLVTVSSVPEVQIMNTSTKRITGFVLAVRHPESNWNRGTVQPKVSIAPGEVYTVRRSDFVSPAKLTVADDRGQTHQKIVQGAMDEEKYWVQFAQRAEIFVLVNLVVFEDGSEWSVKKGGEVK